MITYLKDGWYKHGAERQLRTEVVDGAIDAASMLFQAHIPPHVLSGVAFKLRTLVSIVDPLMSRAQAQFSAAQRLHLWQKIEPLTLGYPVLDAFVRDCLEHVGNPSDLRAFYLHLIHVTQMVQLLSAAIGPKGTGLGSMMQAMVALPSKAGSKGGRAAKPKTKKIAKKNTVKRKAGSTKKKKKVRQR